MMPFSLVAALSAALATAPAPQSAANPDTVISRILDSARALKLPDAPLRSVLQEGRQRNESPARIANALRMYVDVLHRARVALGNNALDAEIDAGASVLLAGGNVRTLGAVRAARPTADVTVALVVLADLVERGVPLTRAEDAVVTLARVGASDAEFHSFRTGVQKDLAAGQGAESSLLKRTRETVSRLQITLPRKQRSLELRGAHIVTAPQWGTPERESVALLAPVHSDVRSQWAVSARAIPIARWTALELRAAAAGAFEGAGEPGETRGEIIAALGARGAHVGVEAGIGAAAYAGLSPRLPIAYGGAWYERGPTQFRLELRGGPARNFWRDADAVGSPMAISRPPFEMGDTLIGGRTQAGDSLAGGLRPGQAGTISELRIGLAHGFGRVSLEGTTGVRFLDATPLDAWNLVGVSARLRGRIGVIAGVASRYAILERAVPSGSFGYLGLRLLPRATDPFISTAPRAFPHDRAVPRARVQTASGQSYLEIDAIGASLVEVTGDFTEWEPRDMARVSSTRWRIALPAAWQMIRVRVRVDGAEWIVPAGLARARSVFGDEVGVLALGGEPSQ